MHPSRGGNPARAPGPATAEPMTARRRTARGAHPGFFHPLTAGSRSGVPRGPGAHFGSRSARTRSHEVAPPASKPDGVHPVAGPPAHVTAVAFRHDHAEIRAVPTFRAVLSLQVHGIPACPPSTLAQGGMDE